MKYKLVITESEKRQIHEMYGLNKNRFLFENEEALVNKVDDSFDENPEKFLNNILSNLPSLSKFKNTLSDKIKFVMNKGNKKTIIPLVVSIILGLSSCVQNPNGEKCKVGKPKNELEQFRVDFEKMHTNYSVKNDMVIDQLNDSLKTDFKKLINKINWDSIPMIIDRIEKVDGNSIIHFGYGGIESVHSAQLYNLVNIEFFAIISDEEALKLEEDKYYRFNFEIITQIDENNYLGDKNIPRLTNRHIAVFFNQDINVEVSDSMVHEPELTPPYFKPKDNATTLADMTYRPMEINLGAWLVKVNSIRPR